VESNESYKDNPHSLQHLKEAIANFIRNIPHAELVYVFANKIKWKDACLQAHVAHFQQLLFLLVTESKFTMRNIFFLQMHKDFQITLYIKMKCHC
jgi:hypothetical protein